METIFDDERGKKNENAMSGNSVWGERSSAGTDTTRNLSLYTA